MKILALSALLLPQVAFSAPENFIELLALFMNILGVVLSSLLFIAFPLLLYGIARYILNRDNEKEREEMKTWIFWAFIALFAMFSLWGIVNILVGTFELGGLVIPQL